MAALCFAPVEAASSDLTKAERSAQRTTEQELIKLAKYAAKGKYFDVARVQLELGLEAWPDSSKLEKALATLEKKAARGGTPKASLAAKLEDKRVEVHAEVAMALAEAALSTEADAPARYEHYLKLIQTHFATQDALDALDLVYYAPYFKWVSGTEAELLEAGGERLDGKSLDAAAVEALNRKHSSWSDPWVLSDDVHEVRTTVSLRQAKQILAYAGAYREYFLRRFGSLWDLQAPTGKLPIVVTETQADLQQQMTKYTGGQSMGGGGVQGAAFYMQTNGKLNPCFVTYEPMEATGRTFTIDAEDFTQLQIPLAHEVTHQIVFEYSKHDYNATRQIQHHFWAVEAIANYMGYHAFDGIQWTLTHPRTIPMGSGMIEGPFAYCSNNAGSLPGLREFMGLTHQQFMTVENYHVAATLAYFLLEGEEGKYQQQFVKLLEAVHKVKDRQDLFETCFPGVDRGTMQQEWLRFVRGLQLDG
jgi:hypothetical protein